MDIKKQLTGYPSIDKPQNKYYKVSPLRFIKTNQTIYNLVFESNKDNMGSTAIEYLGVKWSFEKLKDETDLMATVLKSNGLGCGQTVLMGVSNCPEAVVSLLAINKIGAISKWFDIRAGEKDIEKYINESECKLMIVFDMLLPKVEGIIDCTNIEKVLIVTPADSLSTIKRKGYDIKEKLSIPRDNRYILFREYIKAGSECEDVSYVDFDENRPAIMIQSSGTTGKPKVIVHSNHSATFCVRSLSYSDLPIEEGKVLLNLLPPWIAYAIGEALIYPLSMGCSVILCPTFDPDAIMPYLGKFTVAFAAPFHYRYLYENFDGISERIKRVFYDNVDALVSGGDKISVEENERFEKNSKRYW